MPVVFRFLPDLPPPGSDWENLLALLTTIFSTIEGRQAAELRYQQARGPVQVWLAEAEGKLVGCKLGYERKPEHYYSWLGGVEPAYRGQGIAAELLRQQHTWCRLQGYQRIRTQTYNQWRAMLLLNLKSGFDIVGTQQGAYGLVIVLEKSVLPTKTAEAQSYASEK
ncbi:GNAT family N-acetyltransferase [Hymenobacter taeanensis]|uniref:GNAT family N-acetyltransferase n=1 Tax=Hymenobacter taeanensis TaxID=2735321 RepID=A0A6M6BHK5_9BACT|nr:MULTISPECIES: GNAT family N-acetyltransferase [Hymenobacter]QJX47520.1 GNAT family N-acetyltransferase [Hymenobacter taeanensis]UOQ82996.1 GNAT family N-acetyltransferase [Hymenobacter sp. 5414T-23]